MRFCEVRRKFVVAVVFSLGVAAEIVCFKRNKILQLNMAMKMGTLLERNVKMLFDLIGFKSHNNVRVSGYEVDVYAKYNGVSIIAECKQYEKSNLNVDNLIFQWAGKNKKIKADRVILVLYGSNLSYKHKKLAREEGLIIWNEDDVHKFLELAIREKQNALTEILDNLDIKTEDVIKKRKEKEKSWKPDYKPILIDYDIHKRFEHFGKHVIAYSGKNTYLFISTNDLDGTQCPLEEQLKETVNNSLDPIDTLIFTYEIGEEELKLAEKYKIKCVVCSSIRHRKIGLFSREPEIDKRKTKVKVFTITEIREMVKNDR